MKKIRLEDLSVGDWVCVVEEVGLHNEPRPTPPMKIVALGEGWVQLRIDPEQGDPFEYTPNELRGVPLTDEILLRNGFKAKNKDVWYNYGEGNYSVGIKVSDRFTDVDYCNLCFNPMDVTEVNYGSELELPRRIFVHEFQHLLRLVGIEKEIEL